MAASSAVRFLASGDWQLGMTRHFLDADAQARYSSARIDVIRTMGRLAVERGCEFLVVCGDVFETNAVGTRIVSRALEAMAAVRLPIYLLPGNHDPLNAASLYRSRHFLANVPDNVCVLDRSGVVEVRPGVEIVAAPWFSKRPTTDLLAGVLSDLTPSPGTVRVGVGHGAVDLLDPDRTDPATIKLLGIEEALSDRRLTVQLLGDRHSSTSVGNSGRVWYPGTPEATDYDERDPGRALIVEATPDEVHVSAIQVGTWTFKDMSVRLDNSGDVEDLGRSLTALAARDRTVVRLTLTGTLSLPQKAELDRVLAAHADVLAGLEIWQKKSDLAVLADPAELSELGIGGFVERAAAELIDRAAGHDVDAQSARDAVALLYRLAVSG